MKNRVRKTKEIKNDIEEVKINASEKWHMEWQNVGQYPNGVDKYEWVPVRGEL